MEKISIGCDHAGFEVKEMILNLLNEMGYEMIDFGTNSSESVDYPIYGIKVGESVATKQVDRGIVVCGSGIGISIAANKVTGVRAALCSTVEHAVLSRKHNNANVLAIGARLTNNQQIKEIVINWLNTSFEGGRHQERINLIEKI
tara:strand:- start:585 stop:1019 length:435 start_codon:yes stop_codon:yes gene_type:complete